MSTTSIPSAHQGSRRRSPPPSSFQDHQMQDFRRYPAPRHYGTYYDPNERRPAPSPPPMSHGPYFEYAHQGRAQQFGFREHHLLMGRASPIHVPLPHPAPYSAAIAAPPRELFRSGGCTCKKSRCLKLYCQCFSLSTTCGEKCKCQSCFNTSQHVEQINEARQSILDRNLNAFDDKFRGTPMSPPSSWHPTSAPAVYHPSTAPSTWHQPAYSKSSEVMAHLPDKNRLETPKRSASDKIVASVTPVEESSESGNRNEQDRMAIMAAVAMTELLGGKSTEKNFDKAVGDKHNLSSPVVNDNRPSLVPSEKSDDEGSQPPMKKLKLDNSVSPQTGNESRNPSPTSGQSPHYPTKPAQLIRRTPAVHHQSLSQHAFPSHQQQLYRPHQPAVSRVHGYAPRPVHFSFAQQRFTPPKSRVPSYDEITRTSGLPKSLSFRKICSRCGRTRRLHGEKGFGNKCEFNKCGKCLANVTRHKEAGVNMGIFCSLTVDQGAKPGAAETYTRNLRVLANRAELQKTVMEDKRVRVERLAAYHPFVPSV